MQVLPSQLKVSAAASAAAGAPIGWARPDGLLAEPSFSPAALHKRQMPAAWLKRCRIPGAARPRRGPASCSASFSSARSAGSGRRGGFATQRRSSCSPFASLNYHEATGCLPIWPLRRADQPSVRRSRPLAPIALSWAFRHLVVGAAAKPSGPGRTPRRGLGLCSWNASLKGPASCCPPPPVVN